MLLFALAHLGGVLGYLPLLSLLLPMKVEAMAGEARLGLFTACMVTGGIASSVSNIFFGWLSDISVRRGGGRRRWVLGGIAAIALSFLAVAEASEPLALILAVVAVQIAVNMLLAPLIAIMADEIPDSQKGLTGGLLALSFPLAAAASARLVGVAGLGEDGRLGLVVLAIGLATVPLLATRPRMLDAPPPVPGEAAMLRRDLAIAWAARILMQVAANVLSTYLFYYFETVSDAAVDQLAARVGHVLTVAFLVPVPIALLIGRISDQLRRRKPFLLATAAGAVAGLVVMALSNDPRISALAFFFYSAGSQAFMALHSAFAMQLLPNPNHRGRDLGLLNLTNTLPALLGPLLTWQLATPGNFSTALLALALLNGIGGMLILAVRGRR
nr:MFS transporter [Stakelama flava]